MIFPDPLHEAARSGGHFGGDADAHPGAAAQDRRNHATRHRRRRAAQKHR